MNRQKRFDPHQQHPHYRQSHNNYGGAVPQQGPPNVAPNRMPNAAGGMRAQGMNPRPSHVPQQQQQQQQPQQIQNQQVQQQQAHAGGVAMQQHQAYSHVSAPGHHHHQPLYYAAQPNTGASQPHYIQISPYQLTNSTVNPGIPLHTLTQTLTYSPRYYAPAYGQQTHTHPQFYPAAAAAPTQAQHMYATVPQQFVHHQQRMASAAIHSGSQSVANAQQLQQAPVAQTHGGVVTGISTQHQPQHSHQQQPIVQPQPQPMPRQEQSHKKERKILTIVDPKTGRNVLEDHNTSSAAPTTNSTPQTESASTKGASNTESVQTPLPSSVEKQDFQNQNTQQSQESQDAKPKEEPTAGSLKEEPGTSATERNKRKTEFYQKIAQASDDTRTNSSASTGNSGAPSSSGNQVSADAETPVPAEPVVETPSPTPTPSTPTKEKSPSPEPSKPAAVVSTPVANTSSDDSKDASLVSISPTPLDNYTTPRSAREVTASPLQTQVEKYPEEAAEEELVEDVVTPEEPVEVEPEPEREPSAEPVSLNETTEEVVVETADALEEPRPESELSDSLKQEDLEKDEEIDEQEELIEENQPNGHIPSEIEEGELRDEDDDSTVADSGTDEQDDPLSAKGKIKYDRDTLLMIGNQHNYNDFKVADRGLPDLAKDTVNNHHIKSHGPLMNKNSPGGPRDYGRSRGGMPNQNKGPMMPPALSHMRNVMGGPMQWGGIGMMIPPAPPTRAQPKVQLTLQREEVKLHKAENAWKPSTLKRSSHGDQASDEEQIFIDSIVKKTRGILNKLTPDNFDKLVNKFMELQLEDKDERISSVISVVFEKAIDEPSFSAAYAKMVHTVCKTSQETSKKFRKQILDQCQKEFQKSNTDEAEIKEVEQKLEEATDEESRTQLKLELEEKKYTSRRRSLGNVRFIGELYKLQMLTPKIMVECVHLLLYSPDEENLECLCKLLATVGQKLDMQLKSLEELSQRGDKPKFIPETKWMDRIFKQLESLSSSKKLSSRIRFAILDVVELRQNDWKPRRDTNAPKTLEEVRKEAHRQEMEEKRQINNLPPVQNNYGGGGDRDHRGGGGGGGGGGSRLPSSQPQKKGDWTTVSKASRFQTGAKKSEPVGTGGTPIFGPPSFGGQWGQNKAQSGPPSGPSQPSRPQHEVPPRFLNRFQNLSMDESSRSSNKGNQNSAPEPSGFRKQIPPMFPPHQPHAPPLLPATSPPMSSNSSAANSRPVSPKDNSDSFTADTSETVKNIFQEYLSCHKFDDTLHWIKSRFPGDKIEEFVEEMSRQVGEMSKEVEQKCAGMLLRLLIRNKEIPKETVIRIMAQGVMEDLPDIMIDVPKATTYLAQFLVEMFYEESNLNWLVDVGDRLIHNEDCGESAWNELAVNSLNLLKLRHNEEVVRTSFRKTERRDVIPVDEISWLQDKTLDSLADHMVKVLSPKLNPDSSEEIGQIFQEHSWDVRDEATIRALTEAICILTWNPETASWRDESVKKLLPLLSLPNQKMFPVVWKQVEDYLRKKSIDKKKGEGLWSIMFSLNMTTAE
ncbi:unnamed protein product [Orchesella dallaii]|uniref:MI domain-containing protein n=1 Tax=Orchesella dallaii TaxID=48710 RepID=A0ABP1S9B9_9HEXA